MELKIAAIPNFEYSSEVHDFPIDVTLQANRLEEIISRVDLASALITRLESPDVVFGYVQRITPANLHAIALQENVPLNMKVNIFEHDEDFSDYLPGDYKCEIKIEVHQIVDGCNRVVELKDEIIVSVV